MIFLIKYVGDYSRAVKIAELAADEAATDGHTKIAEGFREIARGFSEVSKL